MIPHTISDFTISVIVKGRPFVLACDDERFPRLVEAVSAGDVMLASSIIDEARNKLMDVFSIVHGDFKVEYRFGHIYVNGELDSGSAANRIVKLRQLGLPVEHLMKFLARLQMNPSKLAVDDLYDFIEANKMPITPEGKIICFKVVQANYRDIHSGAFDNSVGCRVSIARNKVVEDNRQECAAGLHVCGESYIPQFGTSKRDTDRVMLLEVDPADFVAVPQGYGRAKARVSAYYVFGEMTREDAAKYFDDRSRVIHDGSGVIHPDFDGEDELEFEGE